MVERTAGGRFGAGNLSSQSAIGYGVGIASFIDSEADRAILYYREIEGGTTRFVGRTIYGLWSDGPRGSLSHGDLSPFGESRAQQFVPSKLVDSPLDRRKRPAKGVIKEPIVAQNAYRLGANEWRPAQREIEAMQTAFRQSYSNQNTLISQRTAQPQTTTTPQLRARTGVSLSFALTGLTQSLQKADQQFAKELTALNKDLALGLANVIAAKQEELIKRKGVSSGKLVDATLDARNRYPS